MGVTARSIDREIRFFIISATLYPQPPGPIHRRFFTLMDRPYFSYPEIEAKRSIDEWIKEHS